MFSSASMVSIFINGLLFIVRSAKLDAYSSATSFAIMLDVQNVGSQHTMHNLQPHITVTNKILIFMLTITW